MKNFLRWEEDTISSIPEQLSWIRGRGRFLVPALSGQTGILDISNDTASAESLKLISTRFAISGKRNLSIDLNSQLYYNVHVNDYMNDRVIYAKV